MREGIPWLVVVTSARPEDDANFPPAWYFHGDRLGGKRRHTTDIRSATVFDVPKEAQKTANRITYGTHDCVAFAVPLPAAWAMLKGECANWRLKPKTGQRQ